MTPVQRYWIGTVPERDDFGQPITDVFYDGATKGGPWGFMNPTSWERFGVGRTGTGFAQKYKK